MKIKKLIPFGEFIILRRFKEEAVTEGGVARPEQARNALPFAEVLHIGSKAAEELPAVVVGSVVVFPEYRGFEIEVNRELLTVLTPADIIGLVETEGS